MPILMCCRLFPQPVDLIPSRKKMISKYFVKIKMKPLYFRFNMTRSLTGNVWSRTSNSIEEILSSFHEVFYALIHRDYPFNILPIARSGKRFQSCSVHLLQRGLQ